METRRNLWLLVLAIFIVSCNLPGLQERPPRVEQIDAAQFEDYLDGDRLATESLEHWFDHENAPVYRVEVPGEAAVAWWRGFRERVETTGYWPILIGTPDDARMIDEVRSYAEADDNEASPQVNLDAWRTARAAEYAEWQEEPRGDWPIGNQAADFTVDADILSGEFHSKVVLALIPTRNGWEAPLILDYGGWNECPMPEVHAATLRDWSERFGAELVTLSGDVVELAVARPPTDRHAALELAREHYLYCGDIVWQGTNTLEGLAASLVNADVWFFWWD